MVEGKTGVAVDHGRVVDGDQVKPAGSSRSLGGDAVFVAKFPDLVADLVVELGWKWTFSDFGGIGFEDTDDLI